MALAIAVAEAALGLFLVLASAGTLTPVILGLATAVWAAATGVFALGIDGYNAYWTTDKQDAIFCAIVCNIGDNGQFTEAQYQAFRAKVKAVLPASPAFDIVMTAINAGGAQGLSQMASYGSWATADCDSCDCFSDCASSWSIFGDDPTHYHGEILATGDGFIIARSGVAAGNKYLLIRTPSEIQCCVIDAVEPGTYAGGVWTPSGGSLDVLVGWTDCGTTPSEGAPQHTGLYGYGNPAYCTNYFQLQSSSEVFTVKISISDC